VRRRIFVLAVAVVAATAQFTTQAHAHEGNPDFRSELRGIEPSAPGLEVEVLNYDDSLQLRNESGKDVLVYGYDDEPYVRILGDGTVQVNKRSPAHFLNDDRFAQVEVPPEADASAPPEWETVDETGQYSWHDHRIHYMGQGTPNQVKDEGRRTEVFAYEVPIEFGGRPAVITGDLVWVGRDDGFPVLPFVALGLVALGIAGLLIRRRRRAAPAAEAGAEGGKEAW
jgi:LPXTG-motif cell wall-anchored protein